MNLPPDRSPLVRPITSTKSQRVLLTDFPSASCAHVVPMLRSSDPAVAV